MNIVGLLANSGFITFNKSIAKKVGIDEAILLGELCGLQTMYGDNFFCDQQSLMDDTCLTKYRLINAMKRLKELGIVAIEKKGIPCKNYYTVDEEKLCELLDLRKTSSTKFDTTGSTNFDTAGSTKIDTTINNNKNNNKNKNSGSSVQLYEAYELCENYVGRPLSTSEINLIETFTVADELIEEAIRIAECNNVFAMSYIASIINRWKDNGIETLQQAEADRKRYENRRKQNVPKPKEPEIDKQKEAERIRREEAEIEELMRMCGGKQ